MRDAKKAAASLDADGQGRGTSSLSRSLLRHLPTILVPLVVALLTVISWPPHRSNLYIEPFLKPLHRIEWAGYDTLFFWRGERRENVDKRIAVVGFERDSELALEDGKQLPWPPPRRYHGKIVENLFKDGASVVAFDVLLSTPSTHGMADDVALHKALAAAPPRRVILACRINRSASQKSKSVESPMFSEDGQVDLLANAQEGFVNVFTDTQAGDVVRRISPLVRDQDEWMPSLSAAAYLTATNQSREQCGLGKGEIILGKTRFPQTGPLSPDPNTPGFPIASSFMDFPAGISTFPIYRYEQVARGEFAPGTFKGKIVFVGVTGTELTKLQQDKFRTAFSQFNPEVNNGENIPDVYGVVVQAQMLNALLRKTFIRMASPLEIGLLVFGATLLGVGGVRLFMDWRGPALFFAAIALYVFAVYCFFAVGRISFPWVLPSLTMFFSIGAVAYFERGQLRRKWAGYVSPQFLEAMLRQGHEEKPERAVASVIFGDIRGFTTFSEKHDPETVVRLLDKHLDKLVSIVHAENGTVDKYLGDGILCVFGVPLAAEDSIARCVKASFLMAEATKDPIIDDDGKEYVFETGFGLTTGPLVWGNVGAKSLKNFTLIGDTVNLSSRLQAVTGKPDVIIDRPTYDGAKPYIKVQPLGAFQMKGKKEPVECFKVLAWDDAGTLNGEFVEPEEPMVLPDAPVYAKSTSAKDDANAS